MMREHELGCVEPGLYRLMGAATKTAGIAADKVETGER
jgi:hypothetical protein